MVTQLAFDQSSSDHTRLSLPKFLWPCSLLVEALAKQAIEVQSLSRPLNGGVAQLGEHLPCTQTVAGSIPAASTKRRCHSLVAKASACQADYRGFESLWRRQTLRAVV